MPRRCNCCELNHPRPVFCPSLDQSSCTNQVVNPTLTGIYGFFNNTSVGEIATQAQVPLSAVLTNGVSESDGNISLSAGNYMVTYFASGTVPTGGTMAVELSLNDDVVSGSAIQTTQVAGQVATLTQTIAISVGTSGTLSLINNSSETVEFSVASVFVQRI